MPETLRAGRISGKTRNFGRKSRPAGPARPSPARASPSPGGDALRRHAGEMQRDPRPGSRTGVQPHEFTSGDDRTAAYTRFHRGPCRRHV